MHRNQHPRRTGEGAQQAQGEGGDGQQHRPGARKLPRFSVTAGECSSAVPTSHGINEAFSTGSQNHQPPQPSS